MNAASFIRYFFALRPDRRTAHLIGRVRDGAGPFGSGIAEDRFHVTLGIFGEVPNPDAARVAWARSVLAGASLGACDVTLGRLVTEDGIAMLTPAGRPVALRMLQSSLFDRLRRHGVKIRRPERFRPHLTLGYRPRFRVARAIRPIAWLADRVDLIESRVGLSRHRVVASWPLLPPAQASFDFGV